MSFWLIYFKELDLLFMPVINLVNISKNDLVFSLHVLWYTSGAHGTHVALQERTKAHVHI